MSRRASSPVGDVGRFLPRLVHACASTLRPNPLVELREWGGVRLVRGKRVLDLGCGDGRFALALAPYASAVEGLDPDPEAIAAAKKAARKDGIENIHFRVGAAQRLPYPGAAFDMVVLSWTL